MDKISDFYKDKETANHKSYNSKWYHYLLAYDDRYKIISWYLDKYLFWKKWYKILDIACWTWIYERMLNTKTKKNNSFIWFDISWPHIKLNKKDKVFDEIVEWDLTLWLPFEDNIYDIIILTEIIEHLWEPEKIIEECHRCLKKGWIIIFSTPNLSSIQNRLSFMIFWNSGEIDYDKNFQHIRFFSKKGINKVMNIFWKRNIIFQRGVWSLFFYPENFPFFLPIPRFLQKISNVIFPNLGLWFFKVYKKK